VTLAAPAGGSTPRRRAGAEDFTILELL
jgi:hypothetical protein